MPKTKLTRKQKGFVEEYIKTGNGTQSALKVYDVANNNVARSIGSENLTKPAIQQAIADLLPDDLLGQRHLELLNKREVYRLGHGDDLEYEMSDQPDTQAVAKALDMAYKLKGSYAPEKSQALNLNINASNMADPELEAIRKEFEEKLKSKLIV